MPLVNKQRFEADPIPDNLGPDDEVFYHELTNEIFTNHDAYFDRFIYCNSLIWTCSKTGKSGLTYKEALDSEESFVKKKKKSKREQPDEPNEDGSEPVKKKKKKYPYDPKKYSMPVPEGFDPSLLTPTGKIDGRKLKSKKNKEIADQLLSHCPTSDDADTQPKKGKQKKKEDDAKKKEDEAKKKEDDAKRKAHMQAELAKERELEAKRKKEAAALAKQLERQKKEEERKKAAAFLQNWEKKCDDLERDDLRRLPQPTPLNSDIPERLFGDAVFVLESLYNLHDLYRFERIFPDGISYDTLEEMLIDRQEEGPFGTVIQFLLRVIFDTQPTKDGYGLDDDPTKASATVDTKSESTKINHVKTESADADAVIEHEANGLGSEPDEDDENDDKDVNMNDLIGAAIKAAQEVKKSLSKPLPEMELNSGNMTEILRLHLLQSGSFPKGRTIYNGWYSSREDPGLWLCMQEPDLIKKLGEVTLYDLEIEERIKILHTLIYQLFSFIHTRTYVESASDSLTELRKQYRSDAAAFARWDRENCVKRMQPPVNQQQKSCIKTNGTGHADAQQSTTNNDNNDDATHPKKKSTTKTDINGAIDNDNGLEDCENEQNHDEKTSSSPVDDSGQTFEELERAYQQNMVDYADYQRERAIRYEQLSQGLLAIRSDIRHYQSIYGVHPIGRDRAYRRYWLFQSLPGLFVEQDDEYLGRCLPQPTPLESRYKKLFNKENPLMHPNESDLIRTKTCDVGCSTESLNAPEDAHEPEEPVPVAPVSEPETERAHDGNELDGDENSDRLDSEAQGDEDDGPDQQDPHDGELSGISDEMNYCTGDESTCAIHGSKRPTQPRWWFYHLPESIDSLIECLNKRGYRESELHDLLLAESSLIKPYIATCPAYKLNKFIYEQSGIRRSRRLRTKGSKKRGRNYE